MYSNPEVRLFPHISFLCEEVFFSHKMHVLHVNKNFYLLSNWVLSANNFTMRKDVLFCHYAIALFYIHLSVVSISIIVILLDIIQVYCTYILHFICDIWELIATIFFFFVESANEEEVSDFLREIELMKDIGKHENVIEMYGCCTRYSPICLVLEYAPGGNLLNYLRSLKKKVTYVRIITAIYFIWQCIVFCKKYFGKLYAWILTVVRHVVGHKIIP